MNRCTYISPRQAPLAARILRKAGWDVTNEDCTGYVSNISQRISPMHGGDKLEIERLLMAPDNWATAKAAAEFDEIMGADWIKT